MLRLSFTSESWIEVHPRLFVTWWNKTLARSVCFLMFFYRERRVRIIFGNGRKCKYEMALCWCSIQANAFRFAHFSCTNFWCACWCVMPWLVKTLKSSKNFSHLVNLPHYCVSCMIFLKSFWNKAGVYWATFDFCVLKLSFIVKWWLVLTSLLQDELRERYFIDPQAEVHMLISRAADVIDNLLLFFHPGPLCGF